MTDTGRAAVYAAEIAAFEGTSYESVVELGELQALATTITSAPWWPCGRVPVVAARADARSSSTRQRADDRPVVRLAAPQMTQATLVHELAHVLAGVGVGHGSAFRRAHVDLVHVAFGNAEARWLVDAYAAMDLAPGERAWPAPSIGAGSAAHAL
jgi:hypothetical protein